jgi:hypothetical protein
LLESSSFDIVGPVSEAEAEEAIVLFSVVNMLLAGLSERAASSGMSTDALAVRTLYFGLQEQSLPQVVVDQAVVWPQIEETLRKLVDDLDGMDREVPFIVREAKRQFNLGRSREVEGNLEFPQLFRRYVAIANDPLLFIDLRSELSNPDSNKEQLARVFDLLRDLKLLLLALVRSLSRFSTLASQTTNKKWSSFESRAMEVLEIVAANRLTKDIDEQRPLSLLADVTGRNLDTHVAPYVALAREGGELLRIALEVYRAASSELERFDEQHLMDLFQPAGSASFTHRMRPAASVLRQFRLPGWL